METTSNASEGVNGVWLFSVEKEIKSSENKIILVISDVFLLGK